MDRWLARIAENLCYQALRRTSGNDDYLVEGMSFQMGGYWIVHVTVTLDGRTDMVRFGLDL